MSDKAFATIDIGTNTTLLLVGRAAAGGAVEVLAERAEITRLGRGIGTTGVLGTAGIGATLDVLRDYARIARDHGATIAAIGTEGLRRAKNARDFLDPAREILGSAVEVIDGEREATLTFRAVAESFPAETGAGSVAVIDIGGGSTEIIVAERGVVRLRTSLQIGSVRLTERHVHGDPPRAEEVAAVRAEITGALAPVAELSSAKHTHLVGVAGTVTSLAAMTQQLASYDPARVHGFHLTRAALDGEIARLAHATQAEREKFVGLDPRRADVILAGALILQAIAARAGVDAILVSDRGIRWGLLYELLARSEPSAPSSSS